MLFLVARRATYAVYKRFFGHFLGTLGEAVCVQCSSCTHDVNAQGGLS